VLIVNSLIYTESQTGGGKGIESRNLQDIEAT